MALILSLKAAQDFYVGDYQFTLVEITGPTSFTLVNNNPANGLASTYKISDERATEICSDVFVSAGDMHQSNVASVVIDAPHEILILRGDLRRADPEHKEAV